MSSQMTQHVPVGDARQATELLKSLTSNDLQAVLQAISQKHGAPLHTLSLQSNRSNASTRPALSDTTSASDMTSMTACLPKYVIFEKKNKEGKVKSIAVFAFTHKKRVLRYGATLYKPKSPKDFYNEDGHKNTAAKRYFDRPVVLHNFKKSKDFNDQLRKLPFQHGMFGKKLSLLQQIADKSRVFTLEEQIPTKNKTRHVTIAYVHNNKNRYVKYGATICLVDKDATHNVKKHTCTAMTRLREKPVYVYNMKLGSDHHVQIRRLVYTNGCFNKKH
jgi:hypothetical protein